MAVDPIPLVHRRAAGLGTPVDRYDIRVQRAGRVRHQSSIEPRVAIRNLPRGQRVHVTVRAHNEAGWGAASTVWSGRMRTRP